MITYKLYVDDSVNGVTLEILKNGRYETSIFATSFKIEKDETSNQEYLYLYVKDICIMCKSTEKLKKIEKIKKT
jgi:hypothetical protein